jgi:rhodanese-related sulfurtransferase
MSTPHKSHNQGFLKLVNDAKSRVKEVDIDQYKKMPKESHVLIDVREDNEWTAGHAAGAIHLGKGIIERDIETKVPDKSTTLVLYCGGGFRSALAADALRQMGYENPISLDGGWRAWTGAGLPVEKG